MKAQYYPINENVARLSKHMSSFDDYREGSATAAYRSQVDATAEFATQQAERKPDYADEIKRLLGRYAQKLAEFYNREYEIGTRCASILVAGGGNFPVQKKQKQVIAWKRNRETYADAERIFSRMRSIGAGGIKSSDARAIGKLQAKIEDAESEQKTMKDVNSYHRKHGTLEGCPYISEKIARKITAGMESKWSTSKAPFASWALSNNSANIRRMKERVEQLQRERERGEQAEMQTLADGVRVFENVALMRIQLLFDDKPDAETRSILKGEGFRWSPSQSAWQRDLNENGRRAAHRVMQKVAPQAVEVSPVAVECKQTKPLHEKPHAVYLCTEQGAQVKREHWQEVNAGDECETGLGQNALDKWERAGLVEKAPETVTLAEFAEHIGE